MTEGKYKTYPEYKESGIEWLDQIPEHWEIYKIKQLDERIHTVFWPFIRKNWKTVVLHIHPAMRIMKLLLHGAEREIWDGH